MTTPSYRVLAKEERRLQVVMALFRGERASQVSPTFGICRSDLDKVRKRAWAAMRAALKDQPRGPKRPHNRLGSEQAQKVMALCPRHPTHSSSQVQEQRGSDAPCARTMPRIRARNKDCAPREARSPIRSGTTDIGAGHEAGARYPQDTAALGTRACRVGCTEWRATDEQPLYGEAPEAQES